MNHVAGWVYVACALFITGDILGRSLLGVSSQSTVEVTGYMLAFGISWSLAHTLARRCHIRVDVLVTRLPAQPRQWLHGLALVLLCGFALFAAWAAWSLVDESWLFQARDTSALSVPLVVPQGLWAVGAGVFALFATLLTAEVLLLLVSGRGSAVDRMLGPRTIEDEAGEALEAVAMERRKAA